MRASPRQPTSAASVGGIAKTLLFEISGDYFDNKKYDGRDLDASGCPNVGENANVDEEIGRDGQASGNQPPLLKQSTTGLGGIPRTLAS